MYAVIQTGGKQYKISVDDEIFVEKLDGDVGGDITFDRVLAVGDDSGIRTGKTLDGASVAGQIVCQGKNKKVSIVKYKAKKGYRRKTGHRQPYTRVRITAINT